MQKNLLFRAWTRCMLSSLPYFLVLFCVPIISAQNAPITGTVADAQGVLPGVTIQVKNKSATTTTDASGAFQITALPEDTLVFSYIGYATMEVLVGTQTHLNILLKEDATALEEVLVNAGYYKVKDKERTGSIAKITAAAIETQPVTNVLATMQGRMAGVNITQTTGVPGGGFDIQIRGLNSLRKDGNRPLYIIDGVPYSSEPIGFGVTSTIMPSYTSPLNNINPSDIDSIEVLKDADATAIYGSRGANGVVLVTTKKGKKGQTQFKAHFSLGAAKVGKLMKMMNTSQYLAMRAEAFANDGYTEYPADAYDINGTWDPTRYTNWQKELLGGTAQTTNVGASVSGGSENTQFLISSNHSKETTVFPGDFAYVKNNLRVSLNNQSKDQRFRLSFTAGYTLQDNNQPSTDLSTEAWKIAPNAPALYDNEGNLNWENNTFENPLRNLNGKSIAATQDLVANTTISYQLLPQLELKSNLGYTALNHSESSTFPSTIYNPAYGVGSDQSSIFFNTSARQSWIVEPQLNWQMTNGDFKTALLLGSTFQQQKNNSIATAGYGYTNDSMIYNPAAANDLSIMGFEESVYKYQSYFSRLNLNLKERYILNLTARRDGSSRFGDGKRFAWFGAVGAAWIFSQEKGLDESKILSFGKLRGSYGTTGNDQIGNYQFLNTYTPANAFYQGIIGLQPTRLYNADFGWETNKKVEVALETGFLKDRIFITAAWYRNRSSDQLVGIPLPGTTGFPSVQSNLPATVENRGIELTLHTRNIETTTFSWNTTVNFSKAKNELRSFPNLENSTYSNQYVIGQPLNIVKVFHYTGIDPQTGTYTFEDVNGDGTITAPEDQTYTKDLNPAFFGGIHNQLKYKNWQLDLHFQFVKQQNYDTPKMLAVPGTFSNLSVGTLQHWQQEGDQAATQVYTTGANGAAVNSFYNYIASDAVITDASFIRLKNIALGYDLPATWSKHVKCRATIEAQNLLTFTSFKGPDPEFQSIGYLPPLRVITAGLQFTF